MADTVSPEQRSWNMSRIRSKNTKPEEYVRKKLYMLGYRYRKNETRVLGHPDIWLPKYRTAIYVNGCFWHRHQGCKYAYMPKSRVDYWERKFNSNIDRDNYVHHSLIEQGIRVIVIWECTVKKMMKSSEQESLVFSEINTFLSTTELFLEL